MTLIIEELGEFYHR